MVPGKAMAASGTAEAAAPALQSALTGLGTSKSMPTLAGSDGVGTRLPGVSFQSLLKFLKPSNQENPDSVGRLELFGKFGPCDEEGKLRGGIGGAHAHTDIEIKEMIKHNCREALFGLFKKDRRTVEVIVDTLMPVAMSQTYSVDDVKRILRTVARNPHGRMDFDSMQETIFESQQERLQVLVRRAQGGKPIRPPAERPIKVPFQSKSAAALLEMTQKKKFDTQHEESINLSKRLHAYSTLCGSLEDQSKNENIRMNVLLCRGHGELNDRWDRYCALRRVGRSSYVGARNTYRFNAAMDEGTSNKHPGCSSLLAASAGGSSAAAALGAT